MQTRWVASLLLVLVLITGTAYSQEKERKKGQGQIKIHTPQAIAPASHKEMKLTVEHRGENVADVIRMNKQSGYLWNLLKITGFDRTLRGRGPVTFLAPLDSAFSGTSLIPSGSEFASQGDQDQVKSFLECHMLPGKTLPVSQLTATNSLTLAGGKKLEVRIVKGEVYLGNARIVGKGIAGSNGIVYFIDSFLTQPPLGVCSRTNDDNRVTLQYENDSGVHLKKSSTPPLPNFSPVPQNEPEDETR